MPTKKKNLFFKEYRAIKRSLDYIVYQEFLEVQKDEICKSLILISKNVEEGIMNTETGVREVVSRRGKWSGREEESLLQEEILRFTKYKTYFKYLTKIDITSKLSILSSIKIDILNNSRFLTQISFKSRLLSIIDDSLGLHNSTNTLLNILFLNKLKPNKNYLSKLKKKKKWRLKKRKLRKLKIFRKLKKIMIHWKVKKFFKKDSYSYSYFIKKINYLSKRVLISKIPLTKKVVNDSQLELHYKLNKYTEESAKNINKFTNVSYFGYSQKENDLIIYLRNYNQKPYWKLRQSRILHWNLFSNKTIRKQRYKKFIKFYTKKYSSINVVHLYFVNYFTKLNLSWTRLSKFKNFIKKNLIEINKNIIILPLISSKFISWQSLKRKTFKLKKKTGKWSYLNYRRYACPWLQRKKNFPKDIKHIVPNFFIFKQLSFFDSLTGYAYISDLLVDKTLPFSENFKTNLLIRLHMYRYKSNTICLLHFLVFCVK